MSNQNTRTDDLDQLALLHQEQWDELDREHELQRRDDDGLGRRAAAPRPRATGIATVRGPPLVVTTSWNKPQRVAGGLLRWCATPQLSALPELEKLRSNVRSPRTRTAAPKATAAPVVEKAKRDAAAAAEKAAAKG